MFLVQNRISHIMPGRKFRVLCIWPFLFVNPSERLPLPSEVMNHELIHARQQREMLWLFFFLWYALEFMIRWIQHRDRFAAYRALSHEKEAYQNEHISGYLSNRKNYAWIKCL